MNQVKNNVKKGFTVVPNALINDNSMSPQARFLFVYMASKPDDWRFRQVALAKDMQWSVDTLRKYQAELMVKGWMTREQNRAERERFDGFDYVLHPEPCREITVSENFRDGKKQVLTNKELIQRNIFVDEQNSEFGSDCLTGASCAPHRNDQQIETQPHPLPPPRDKKKKGKYETQACRDDYEKYKSNVKVNYQNLYNSNVKILTHEQYSCLKSARGQMPKDIEDKYLDLLKVAHMSLNDNPASRQKFTSVIALYDSGLSNQGLLTLSKIIDHESTEGSLPESYKISRSPFSVACD